MSTLLTRGSSSGLGLGVGVGVAVAVQILAPALTFLVQILGFSGFRGRLSEEEEEAEEGEEGWVWVKGMEHMAMPSSPSPA